MTTAALDFSAAPIEVIVGGGAFVLATVGFLAAAAIQATKTGLPAAPSSSKSSAAAPAPLPRENAALVFGASGRTGRQIVAQLLAAGRTVVAAVRDEGRAAEAFAALGISPGRQPSGGILFIESGVNVTNAATLTSPLFKGATQVICALGPVFGRTADGAMGYLDGMTSEAVDAGGVAAIAAAAATHLPAAPRRPTVTDIMPMRTAEDLTAWQRLDDVIMGGNSSSGLEANGTGAVWRGELVIEGGGFCGARTQPQALDLSRFDGITLRVRSDGGQTLKLNLKTDTFSEPEDTYQATFQTDPNGDWTTVYLPWHEFVPVKRARSVPGGPPLDPSSVRQFGLVYSRFAFNGFPNESYAPGSFEIEIEGGIRAYTAPRPQVLLVSSAGVERNARIGEDEEARKRDIPIVQLNPGGTLNHKYSGEAAVRASGLSYSVIRATGMSDEVAEAGPALLEASQGDRISGKIARSELAALVATAAGLPAAAGKTIEVRRSEASDAQGKAMDAQETLRLFLGCVQDSRRQAIGLEPFPAPAPPPAPPSEERKAEILADPRVKEARERSAGGRVRSEEESAGAKSVTAVDDGRGAAAPVAEKEAEKSGEEVPENVQEVREWIRKSRANNLEKQLRRMRR